MSTTTNLRVKLVTKRDLIGDDLEKMVKSLNRYLDLIELTGIGERLGIEDINIRLSDK